MKSLLDKLHIKPVNPGACTGPDGWIEDPNGRALISYNPATGEEIARIIQATPESYEQVLAKASRAFQTWRETPAPK